MCKNQDNLGSIESDPFFGKPTFTLEMREELASVDVVEDHVEFGVCLKGVVEFDDKGVLDLLENGFFGTSVCHLLACNDGILPEHFHRVNFAVVSFLDLHHLAKTAFANHMQ